MSTRLARRLVLLVFLPSGVLAQLPAAAPDVTCKAEFGEVVENDRCNRFELPSLTVRFIGYSQPMADLPVVCWNYEASVAGSATTPFRQCHTGELGGHTTFAVAEASFTVLFDVAAGCARSPAGSWAQRTRGLVFYPGVLAASRIEQLGNEQEKAEVACYSRPK
jgi:hypothetical protein